MQRLIVTFLMVLMIFAICTLAAKASTQELLTTDTLGYTCVAEEDLDEAFYNQGKGGSVPQTCLTDTPTKNCESLTPLLGREPTTEECATHAYRYLSWFDPDRSTGWGWDCGDCEVTSTKSTPPPAVPVPASLVLVLSALVILFSLRAMPK